MTSWKLIGRLFNLHELVSLKFNSKGKHITQLSLPRESTDAVTSFATRGVLLGILGGGVPPSSSNPDPISDQRM